MLDFMPPGYIVDVTGNWQLPFYGSVGLLLLGAVLAFTTHPERKFVDTPVAADIPEKPRPAG
jgi:hypothetical protein